MSSQNNNFGLGCFSLVMMTIGLVHIVPALTALRNGMTVSLGKGKGIQVSPWFTIVFGCIFLGLGISGVYKAWKDRS